MYPVLIKGKSLVNDNLDKIIGKAFNEQYCSEDQEKYLQNNKERKVLPLWMILMNVS